MAFWAVFGGFGLLFYILLGSRYFQGDYVRTMKRAVIVGPLGSIEEVLTMVQTRRASGPYCCFVEPNCSVPPVSFRPGHRKGHEVVQAPCAT